MDKFKDLELELEELDLDFNENWGLYTEEFDKIMDDEFADMPNSIILEKDNVLDSITLEKDNVLAIEDFELDSMSLENLSILDDFLDDSEELDDSFINTNTALVISKESNTNVVLRRPLSMMDTLDQYEPMFVRLTTLAKDYDLNKKASDEIGKRLIRFYDEHNDILPNIMLDRASGGGSIQSYVIHKIRNHCSVKDILETLKKFFIENAVVASDNNRFFISAENENRVILFLNEMKSFYSNDLSVFEKMSQKQDLVTYDFGSEMKQIVNVISNPNINLVYPEKIFLEKESFICGGCKKEVKYDSGFLKTVIMNTSSENDFLSVYPTFEICSACKNINVLPCNYFEVIASNLKENFKKEVDIKIIRERLQELSHFTVYPYQISRNAYYDALPNDLSNFFEKDQYTIIPDSEEVEVKKLDVSKSISDYLKFVSQLESGKKVSSEKLTVSKNSYSLLARMFCFVFGVDYSNLKNNAIQSILYFFDDFIPFLIKPSVILDFCAAELAGIEKREDFSKEYKEYVEVLTLLEKKKDYFCFIPITHYFVDCPSSKFLAYDKRLQKIIDYISDSMIMFHLQSDLVNSCKIGLNFPFLRNRASFLRVLESPSKSLLKQFNSSLYSGQPSGFKDIIQYQSIWITNTIVVNPFVANLLKYFSRRDIYGLVKEVFSDVNKNGVFQDSLKFFKDEVLSQNKLEFYYKELFPEVDFSLYSDEGITIFFQYDQEDEGDFESYLKVLKTTSAESIKNISIKYADWFSENISIFFDVLVHYILCKVDRKDILYIDILRYLLVYDIDFIAQVFGINKTLMEISLSSTSEYSFDEVDIELELIKRFLLIFPYSDPTLQLLLSENDINDLDAIISILLSEKEILACEFSGSSEKVKGLLKKKFNIPI